jgi:predicted ArsR family transcriptional regulator
MISGDGVEQRGMAGRTPTVSDAEILRYIRDSDAPVVGTSEVADAFGYSTNTGARKRLQQLDADGLVASKKLGRVPAWWITEAGRESLTDD